MLAKPMFLENMEKSKNSVIMYANVSAAVQSPAFHLLRSLMIADSLLQNEIVSEEPTLHQIVYLFILAFGLNNNLIKVYLN